MKLSVHTVDTAAGGPAAGVSVSLARRTEAGWEDVAHGRTLADGRLIVARAPLLSPGTYRIEFALDDYFGAQGHLPLFRRATVELQVYDQAADIHLPLLITQNSIFTYRGVG